jgi:hypothetical protein
VRQRDALPAAEPTRPAERQDDCATQRRTARRSPPRSKTVSATNASSSAVIAGEAEQVEADVAMKERIRFADGRRVKRHEHRHPLRGRNHAAQERDGEGAESRSLGIMPETSTFTPPPRSMGQLGRPGLRAVSTRRFHMGTRMRRRRQERRAADARDERLERRTGSQSRVPEPVGHEGPEPRKHDQRDKRDGDEAQHDLPHPWVERRARG